MDILVPISKFERKFLPRIILFLLAVFVLACAPAFPANADPETERSKSARDKSREDTKACDLEDIEACSREINSGRWHGHELALTYAHRASGLAKKKDIDRALADYNQAIQNDPGIFHIFNSRAILFFLKNDFDRAIVDYNQTIKLNPKYAAAYAGRARAWGKKGDMQRAIADIDEAIKLDPKNLRIWNRKTWLLIDAGRPQEGLGPAEEALKLNPDYSPALNGRGRAREALGDFEGAQSDFRSALAKLSAVTYTDEFSSIVENESRQGLERVGVKLASKPNTPANQLSAIAPRATIPTLPSRRVAFVIGNDAYANAPKLINPKRDAESVAFALRRAGFATVTLENNLSRERLISSLRVFARAAEGADWALVYYAGHGIERNGINYLVPTDATLETDRDIQFEGVPLDQVLSAVDGASQLRLVILDACRDNPFANKMQRAGGSRSVGRGLARIEPDPGTLVVYAARAGQVASDGDGNNSPFAAAFVKSLATPGIEVRKLFDVVRDDVMDATGKRQQPFTYGSLPGRQDFYFVQK